MTFIVRARLFHTPASPFSSESALVAEDNGAIAVRDGRIVASGVFDDVRRTHPDAAVHDYRPALVFPGFVDTHVHFSQLYAIGAMGKPLLEWLQQYTLPEEVRLADDAYARHVALEFLRALARNGTTSALVFGSHLPGAQQILFEEAAVSGLRIASGLALADRRLLPPLHMTPEHAYDESLELARRWHGQAAGKLRYAVTPRFAVSASESMLEVGGALLNDIDGSLFQTHLNENRDEIDEVAWRFPWAADYLVQMLHQDGYELTPAHLLYLATRAGAEALGMDDAVGDLSPGKAADFVLVDAPPGSTLAGAVQRATSPLDLLGIVFTLADEESIARVYVEGECIYTRDLSSE